ncbi:mCG1044858, isoform CRA_b [Mus musculus]|nr:mCG1044858, isoform CRA_b [Mus musculus]EDL32368.1 mCG1044858, isoform CRA_b [Mus musculus]
MRGGPPTEAWLSFTDTFLKKNAGARPRKGPGTRFSTHPPSVRSRARGFASAKTSNEPHPCVLDCDEIASYV